MTDMNEISGNALLLAKSRLEELTQRVQELEEALAKERADAGRYRWLRLWANRAGGPVIAMDGGTCPGQESLFDAAIDAARSVLNKETK